ncbi:MAG TPA: LpxL/LpxP family Kdo(2)-lipid IV(A) lauroyl/palmitoleoyl acyltransferase [Xanthomonadales bacterium]|nr:LpxL/LpxP family Kdo(2)-lipid IV(A) lauroyl/palmitoleoyl acyltransferase [Xanthomonadales bacterium]
MAHATALRPPITPSYWPGWLGVGLLWLLGRTPQSVAVALSGPVGALMRGTMGRRRQIARRNIERCFPGLDEARQQEILRGCFRSLARAVFEITWAWSASDRTMLRMLDIEGLEHVKAARKGGAGVLLITAHITSLEIGARLMALGLGPDMPASGIYRPLKSPVLEWYQNRGRARYANTMISKREMRGAIRLLRRGGMVWYAPDQDFGRDQSVFVPFFGIQTATLLATHRLAQLTSCAVVPMFPVYNEQTRRYTIRFLPALETFPGPDPVADLERVNALMEAHIRSAPEQYWWIHRRFKTRPEGEAPFYD